MTERELGLLMPKELQKSDWSGALSPEQFAYAANDVANLAALQGALERRLVELHLEEVFDLECQVLPVVVDMELAGVLVNRAKWGSLVDRARAEADALEVELRAKLAVDNLDSPQQVVKGLERIGITTQKTGADALAKYRSNPIVGKLLEWRQKMSFMRGAGAAVLAAIDASLDGRVRASLDQLGAPTGRFASHGPNLLGLPKADEVRDCIEASPGAAFVDADYATIELRVLANVTRDTTLMTAFRQGQDLHRLTASLLLGTPIEQVTKQERQRAKAVNFGFAFGMGAPKFKDYALKNYGAVFSDVDAQRSKASYLRSYREVTMWQERAKVDRSTEVRTASGRLRIIEPRAFTERLNTPVQGTAADGAKRALVLLRPRLKDLGARLILFVHDQVLVEAPAEAAAEVKVVVEKTLIEGMQHYVPDVPIVVEASVKKTWK